MHICKLLFDLFYLDEAIPQAGYFSSEMGLVESLEHFINGVRSAVVRVEHVQLCHCHWYCALHWRVHDQID